jgi:hypothetical protein
MTSEHDGIRLIRKQMKRLIFVVVFIFTEETVINCDNALIRLKPVPYNY